MESKPSLTPTTEADEFEDVDSSPINLESPTYLNVIKPIITSSKDLAPYLEGGRKIKDKYEFGTLLGKGTYSSVKLAVHR